MVYPEELLDRFDAAAGAVAAATKHLKEYSGKPGEAAAKHDLDVARAAYDEVNSERDALDA